jgi:hypothetical protein
MEPGSQANGGGACDEILEQASWPENTFQGAYLSGKDNNG